MELIVGNDIGNSETKAVINDILIKQPSVTKRLTRKPDFTDLDEETNVAQLLNNLLVHVSSNAIKRDGRFFVGERANVSAKNENMNINLGSKYTDDIPIVMSLSMLSARAIQLHYHENKEVPSTLEVDVEMVTAIPASEYSKAKAAQMEKKFIDNEHIVTVYVGAKSVTVKLKFNFVKVTQEGVPALYAFIEADGAIMKYYKRVYPNDGLMPFDLKDKKILHADIGDGTTEYIYTKGLNPVLDACSGERRGVGHATEEAVVLLEDEVNGYANINRQQFTSMLRDESHRLHEYAEQFMDEASFIQSSQILEDIKDKYANNAGGDVDIITVYGGGSIVFQAYLYGLLIEFAETVHCKILWVPEEFALDMNATGMGILMRKVYSKRVS